MKSRALEVAVQKDHDALRKQLRELADCDGDVPQRDAFLDAWMAYSSSVGRVLLDSARTKLADGDAIVAALRKELPAFQQKFAVLENADDIPRAAREVASAFEAQLDTLMRNIVVPLGEQLDDDEIAHTVESYLRARPEL